MESFVILAGIATFINFAVIYWKFTHGRILSAIIDTVVMVTAGILFVGTMAGMSIAMIASSLFSGFLFFFPPKVRRYIRS